MEDHPAIKVVEAPELDGVLSETLLLTGHFDTVIGLTSTTLIYSLALPEPPRVLSIASRFAVDYPKAYRKAYNRNMPQTGLRLFKRDYEVLRGVAKNLPGLESPFGWEEC